MLQTIKDVIADLNIDEYEKEYDTYQDIVDEIVLRGNTEHVYPFDDEHLNFTNDMSSEFLNSKIDNPDILEKYEDEIDRIIYQANNTSFYYKREITPNIQEAINEDKILRGIEDDD